MACELQDDGLWPALLSARTEFASAIGDLLFVQHGTTWRCIPAMAANLRGARQVLAAPDPRVTAREAPQAPSD